MGFGELVKKEIILGNGKYISENTLMEGCSPVIMEFFREYRLIGSAGGDCYRKILFSGSWTEEADEILKRFDVRPSESCEAHLILAEGDTVRIFAKNERGLLYGAMALLHMAKGNFLDSVFLYNAPICGERGMKVFVPSRKNIPFFKKFVNMLTYYKFNTVMIEVGGAMEYRRHPEINTGWIEYCREMGEYSGKTKQIQDFTYPWYKNAIHMENGGGSYLTQEEMRELVTYCRERGMDVIPEVPSLGHCDYLMFGNEDISERPEDPYPDTYCPSNPRSYEILFDVIDEIVDVFKPSEMNIGHDEYYTIGICPLCRNRKSDDIFADDVNKIAAYLKEKNVKTMIWGDKLLKNAIVEDAGPFGGAEMRMYRPAFHAKDGEFVGIIPATWQAVNKVSKEVLILHWLWTLSPFLEDEVLDAGFDTRYGNFDSYLFADWHKHMEKPVRGAVISNWSSLEEKILQRNGIFFNVSYAYGMFWDPEFDENDFDRTRREAFDSLYKYKNTVLSELDETEDAGHAHYIEIEYNTDLHIEFKWFVDGVFPENELYEIGAVTLSYEDGSTNSVPVIYGENIGYEGVSWKRGRAGSTYTVDDHLYEMTYSTLPIQDGDVTWYRYLIKNPEPEKKLTKIAAGLHEDSGRRINVKSIRYLKRRIPG